MTLWKGTSVQKWLKPMIHHELNLISILHTIYNQVAIFTQGSFVNHQGHGEEGDGHVGQVKIGPKSNKH